MTSREVLCLVAAGLGATVCLAVAAMSVYLREKSGVDWLGMFFLPALLIPAVAAVLVGGVVPALPSAGAPPPHRFKRVLALVLRPVASGLLCFVVYSAAIAVRDFHGDASPVIAYLESIAVLAAFAALLWTSASFLLQPATAPRPGPFATSVTAMIVVDLAFMSSNLWEGHHGTLAQGLQQVALLVLWLGLPSLAFLLSALWALGQVRRLASTSRASPGRQA